MIIRKVVFFVFIVSALAFTTRDSVFKNTSVNINTESSLLIKGTTNINTFSCIYNTKKFKNPIQINYHMEGDKMTFNKTALILDATCFDCGGNAINSDFRKILKSDKYPQIFLFLKEISLLGKNLTVQALIDIEIAGITKTYKIPVNVKNNKGILITGDLDISLSNYNLEAPKKLFGLIVVEDTIEIFFQLLVNEN